MYSYELRQLTVDQFIDYFNHNLDNQLYIPISAYMILQALVESKAVELRSFRLHKLYL